MFNQRCFDVGSFLLLLLLAARSIAAEPLVKYASPQEFWADFDPRQLPLEIEVVKAWDEEEIHLEQLYFTGEIWQGSTVRVFAYRAAPKVGSHLAGVLHLHGGGQTASIDWVRFWAKKGYVCVSHDFCGSHPGRLPEMVTSWGKAPGYMADPSAPKSSLIPSAKYNSWYHWILVARRALTLLESHPQVDSKKLGVFGISVGGTLTWMVAGCDDRVAAAVPIYGVGQNTYTFPWQSPEDPVEESVQITRALLEAEGYAASVKAPLLFMNASNDHHGRLDLGMRTLQRATQSKMLREVYTPHTIHHIGRSEAKDLPLWMDHHLRGQGAAWPNSPQASIVAIDSVPQIVVSLDQPEEVSEVSAYYGLNNPWPTSRFYRTVSLSKQGANRYLGPALCWKEDDTLYYFANVTYRNGVTLSTRLGKTNTKELGVIRPTLLPTQQIDSMDNSKAWFWWLAGTDPLDPEPLLKNWKGPTRETGFTHASPGGFSFATTILSDPQHQRTGKEVLCIDVHGAGVLNSFEITVGKKFFQPGHTFYKTKPMFPGEESPWKTLHLTPSNFVDEKGEPLETWQGIEFLCLSGTVAVGENAVFKNLRWETDNK